MSSPKGQKTNSQRAELEAWLKRHRRKAVQWFEDCDSTTNLQREATRTSTPHSIIDPREQLYRCDLICTKPGRIA
ncbi:MAG: hypothetical protein JO266_17520 [Acidobacteria bacterium]|nr:hypothetical protein [Acidobacteriota bacterium]